jgi:hypothetical protein
LYRSTGKTKKPDTAASQRSPLHWTGAKQIQCGNSRLSNNLSAEPRWQNIEFQLIRVESGRKIKPQKTNLIIIEDPHKKTTID